MSATVARPGRAEQDAAVAFPGGAKVLGDYELLGSLGQGAMGVVHRARHLPTGGVVALKLIRGAGAALAREERFRREAALARGLDHPGIVRVLDAGDAGGVPFIAFELIDGARTLREVLPERPRGERVALVRDVARAIGAAHARGVVHRDLKPENVLVDPGGTPRVTDFGLATARGLTRLTNTGVVVGTPLYMAPEQFAADRARIGPATDVWALGVMLHEALVDAAPFPADSNLLEMAVRVRAQVRPPAEVDATVPPALSAACARALAVEPEERFADGEALAAALDAALGVGARPRPRRHRLRRRPRALAAACAVVTVAAAVGGLALTRRDDPPADDPVADALPAPSMADARPVDAGPVAAGPGVVVVGTVLDLAGVGECTSLPANRPTLLAAGRRAWALIRAGRGGLDSAVEVYRTTDAGRTWAQVATTRDVVPFALAGSLAALPDGRVGVLAHGGDIVARRLGAWYGELDPESGAWAAPLEPVLDPHADDYGWLDGALAASPSGPIVAGMTGHRRALFCRRGVNGWTPLQAISDAQTGFAYPAADDAGGSIHFAFSAPRTQTHPGALRYRRWEHFEWAAEGIVELEASVPSEFCLDVDREGTAHALWVVDGAARYASRRGSGAFERREVATLSPGAEVALQVEPRPAVFLLERSLLHRIDLSGAGGLPPKRVADLSSLGTVSHLSVPRRSDEDAAVVALVTVKRGKADDRVVAIGAQER